jgi:hypothetical protein
VSVIRGQLRHLAEINCLAASAERANQKNKSCLRARQTSQKSKHENQFNSPTYPELSCCIILPSNANTAGEARRTTEGQNDRAFFFLFRHSENRRENLELPSLMIHHDLIMIRQVISGFPAPLRNSYLPRLPESGNQVQTTLHDLFTQPISKADRRSYKSTTALVKFTKDRYARHRITRLIRYIQFSYSSERKTFHPDSQAAVFSELVKTSYLHLPDGSLEDAKSVLKGYSLDNPAPYNMLITQLCLHMRIKDSVACLLYIINV